MKQSRILSLPLTVIILFISVCNFSCKKEKVKPPEEDSSLAKNYTSDVVNDWFSLLASTTRTNRYPPAPSIRIFAFSSIALYETVVTGMPSYQSIYKHFTNNTIDVDPKKDYHWPTAANAALASISGKLIKNFAATADLTTLQQLEARFNTSFQNEVTPEQLQLSIDFGKYVADKIYDWSITDGTLNPDGKLAICPAYVPLGTPGSWVPTPTAFASAAGACQGNLRTFISNIVNTTLPPPLPYSTDPSSDFYKMANEVYQTSLSLTAEDIKLVQSWRDFTPNFNTPSHLLKLSSHIAVKEKLNLEDAAVLYAKLTISMSDAIASVFKAKFHYAQLRPITYIRNVMGHTTWNSVTPTPQHPAYPSTVTSGAAAGVSILEKFFGNNYPVIDSTQQSWIGTWSYASLDEFVKNTGKSKILAGHNYRFAVDAGVAQGRMIANMVHLLPFKKP